MKLFSTLFKRPTIQAKGSQLIERGDGRNLYRTEEGLFFWLDPSRYLDQCIIHSGVFEPESTKSVKSLVKPGDVVLDVGANIGYYAVSLSRLVGAHGCVLCFEPTEHYRRVLMRNISENQLVNCTVYDFGLSDAEKQCQISVGECSATFHWTADAVPQSTEMVSLKRLDDFVDGLQLQRLDFIKVDLDGHEPAFLSGAWATIERFSPIIMLEVSHENYLAAGVTAWEFYDQLKERGFLIYSEVGLEEIVSKRQFLRICGNFSHSANIFVTYKKLGAIVS